ncbi:MAG: CBS domain-containing protein, partial [Gammaproteobacteria bacterium]|nr:CBS domain-containing protein [Gammaproteobacteria bacterium]
MVKLAKDVMSSPVLTVGPDTPLTDLNRMFVEDELHGAPVVGESGRMVGFVSTADLLRAVEEEHEQPSAARSYFHETLEFSGPDWASAPADFQDRLSRLCTSDVMQTTVFTVGEDATVAEVATLL